MRKNLPAWLVLAAALPVLAQPDNRIDRPPIEVTVVDGKVAVSEEDAPTTARHVALVWTIQPGFRFADKGIEFDNKGKGRLNCFPTRQGQRFRCEKKGHFKGERYKYDVKVIEIATGKELPVLDPFVTNE